MTQQILDRAIQRRNRIKQELADIEFFIAFYDKYSVEIVKRDEAYAPIDRAIEAYFLELGNRGEIYAKTPHIAKHLKSLPEMSGFVIGVSFVVTLMKNNPQFKYTHGKGWYSKAG